MTMSKTLQDLGRLLNRTADRYFDMKDGYIKCTMEELIATRDLYDELKKQYIEELNK